MYKIESHVVMTTTQDYIENYVDVPKFLGYCKKCDSYGKNWSCPEFNFDAKELWKKYKYVYIIGTKVIFDKDIIDKIEDKESVKKLMEDALWKEKKVLMEKLWKLEEDYPGAISLSAGSCKLCKTCQRQIDKHCIHPDKMRYSIESIGGDVGKTLSKLLGIELQWAKDGKLPEYYTLVSGLLTNKGDITIEI